VDDALRVSHLEISPAAMRTRLLAAFDADLIRAEARQ